MSLLRPLQRSVKPTFTHLTSRSAPRTFTTSQLRQQEQYPSNQQQYPHPASRPAKSPSPSTNFYKSHSRALFKNLTMAFLSYQIFYWAWLTFETEAMKDEKGAEIRALEGEVRLLGSGRGTHVLEGKRLLDDPEENREGR
ncbi:hypothetical protein LTR70_005419 [Exophiala xenobiotica]|uniref:Uncharacterized protein n=1 Tax=Lithohypha guttulata TaxID=1690604 RepID=A0ABR0KA22_9EURO|nr:hypothetical protein LTR24_005161 [Lithohypha guttulata]KAK5318397.1 hypothetical protein LTR70_005419 [Exophiala xenobiotica]